MAVIKTAVSINARLFQEADRLARRMHVPRSRLFTLALEEFLDEHRNRRLLEDLNRAYAAPLDRAERRLLKAAKGYAARRLSSEW